MKGASKKADFRKLPAAAGTATGVKLIEKLKSKAEVAEKAAQQADSAVKKAKAGEMASKMRAASRAKKKKARQGTKTLISNAKAVAKKLKKVMANHVPSKATRQQTEQSKSLHQQAKLVVQRARKEAKRELVVAAKKTDAEVMDAYKTFTRAKATYTHIAPSNDASKAQERRNKNVRAAQMRQLKNAMHHATNVISDTPGHGRRAPNRLKESSNSAQSAEERPVVTNQMLDEQLRDLNGAEQGLSKDLSASTNLHQRAEEVLDMLPRGVTFLDTASSATENAALRGEVASLDVG